MIQLKKDIPQSSPLIIAKKQIVQEQLEYIETLNKSKSIINQLYLILRKQQEESRKENEKLQKELADQISLSDKLLQKLKQQELEKQSVFQKYQIDELEKKIFMQEEQSIKKIDELIKTIESQKKILQEHESRRIQIMVDNAQSQIVHADELFDKCTKSFLGEIEKEFDKAFSMLGVTICYQQIYTYRHIYDNKKQQFKSQITKGIQVEARNLTIQRFKSGMNTLQNYLKKFNMYDSKDLGGQTVKQILIGLKKQISLGKGQQFEKIENYKRWESDEYTDIEHKPGQVLLIEYWSALSDKSVRKIKENTTLLKYFAGKWGNKLRVVSLSLVLAQKAQNFMESNKESEKYIEFYFPKEQNQLDQLKYDCQFIPHCVLVDELGIIRKTGYSDNIEKCVNKLLWKQVSFNKQNQINVQIDPVQFRIFLDTLIEMLKETDPFKNLDVKIQFTANTVGQGPLINNFKLSYYARESLIKNICNNSRSLMANSKKISKTVSIPYPGNKCSVCNKDIINEPQQYYSPFKFEHVCNLCAEYDDKEKKGNQRYKYLDTLIFINGPLSDLSVLNNIDDHKIGLNLKLLDGEEGNQFHNMFCNGCGSYIQHNNLEKGPRYISLTARPGQYRGNGFVDYCQKCFLQLKNKDSIEAKQIVAKDAQDGMIIDSVFTRVLFNYGSYKSF